MLYSRANIISVYNGWKGGGTSGAAYVRFKVDAFLNINNAFLSNVTPCTLVGRQRETPKYLYQPILLNNQRDAAASRWLFNKID
jgi:hypothetical protein